MKKLFSILFVALTLLGISSCTSNGPEDSIREYFEIMKSGEYEKIPDLMHFKNEPTVEQKQGITALFRDKVAKQIEKDGGLDSYRIENVDMAEDNQSATVKYTITYGNGKTKTDTAKLVNEDGKWKFDLGK